MLYLKKICHHWYLVSFLALNMFMIIAYEIRHSYFYMTDKNRHHLAIFFKHQIGQHFRNKNSVGRKYIKIVSIFLSITMTQLCQVNSF